MYELDEITSKLCMKIRETIENDYMDKNIEYEKEMDFINQFIERQFYLYADNYYHFIFEWDNGNGRLAIAIENIISKYAPILNEFFENADTVENDFIFLTAKFKPSPNTSETAQGTETDNRTITGDEDIAENEKTEFSEENKNANELSPLSATNLYTITNPNAKYNGEHSGKNEKNKNTNKTSHKQNSGTLSKNGTLNRSMYDFYYKKFRDTIEFANVYNFMVTDIKNLVYENVFMV